MPARPPIDIEALRAAAASQGILSSAGRDALHAAADELAALRTARDHAIATLNEAPDPANGATRCEAKLIQMANQRAWIILSAGRESAGAATPPEDRANEHPD